MDFKTVIGEAIDALSIANNESGYCTCGKRVVMHRNSDHRPIDSGEKKAEEVIAKLRKMLA